VLSRRGDGLSNSQPNSMNMEIGIIHKGRCIAQRSGNGISEEKL
jgi:hypothetical protein